MQSEEPNTNNGKPKALLTGATGMLGRYVHECLRQHFAVDTLGRNGDVTFHCDLLDSVPDLGGNRYDLVVHCAGTESDSEANLNSTGTEHLLRALDANPPRRLVYVSSYSVYGEEGEDITEDAILSPTTTAAQSKEKGERIIRGWAGKNGVTLTIIRPARMFGTGVGGETLQMFNDALHGSLIHLRGNDARVSLVTALDVAHAISRLYPTGGTYNLADGRNPRFIDMVMAMTANAGQEKRPVTLPPAWAEWVWRLGKWIPAIDRNLNPKTVGKRMKTLTIDGSKLSKELGTGYFNTTEVIARREPDYPYAEK